MALKQLSSETITVSTAAIGITSSLLVDTTGRLYNVIHADFQHRSGGKINCLAQATPVAAGGNGETQRSIGDEWRVIGYSDLVTFKMVKQTGEADAVVDVQLYGTPGKTS